MKRLGRGLGSLIQAEEAPEKQTDELSVAEIRPNPFQPRRVFDPAGLGELRDSIKNHGVLQPIIVRQVADGYQLVSGERRWRASRLAGLDAIPAIVRPEVSDQDMLELALVENVQRRDLNPIERGRAFRELMEALGSTQQEVADKVGLKRSSVANLLRILELPEAVQALIGDGSLGMGHGRALLGLQDPAVMEELAKRAATQGLSVREVERLVRDLVAKAQQPEEPPKPQVVEPDMVPWAKAMEDSMRESLGTRVQLKNGPKYRGQIVIHYYNREDLERVYDVISPREEI